MGTDTQNTNDGQGVTPTWLVITNSAGKFICKTPQSRDWVISKIDEEGALYCDDVFDYACPMQTVPAPGGGMRLMKANFASRLDSTLNIVGAYISLRGALVYFIDDLSLADKEHYRQLIQDAVNGAQMSAKERASRASGIITATELPGGPLGRRS